MVDAVDRREPEERLAEDLVVQRMAAGLRNNGVQREAVANEDGSPRPEFVGRANKQYKSLGGNDPGPLEPGAIGRAVIALAYDTPGARYSVRFTGPPLNQMGVFEFDAVTPVELGVLVQRRVVAELEVTGETSVRLRGRVGFVMRSPSRAQLAAFTIKKLAEQ